MGLIDFKISWCNGDLFLVIIFVLENMFVQSKRLLVISPKFFLCNSVLIWVINLIHLFFYQRVPNLIGGKFVDSQSSEFIDVINPVSLSL